MNQYSIVYSSRTGNTQQLAQAAANALPAQGCLYCGPVQGRAQETAPLVLAGFWTDKGGCDEAMAAYLQGLRGKQVFLFGTAGFGGSPDYFARILANVQAHLAPGNTVVGSYMCQGRMPQAVAQRYQAMLRAEPQNAQAAAMLANFKAALPHPDAGDLARLAQLVQALA